MPAEQRLDCPSAAPEAYRAMLALTQAVNGSGLEEKPVELVFLRCSQTNGFCNRAFLVNPAGGSRRWKVASSA